MSRVERIRHQHIYRFEIKKLLFEFIFINDDRNQEIHVKPAEKSSIQEPRRSMDFFLDNISLSFWKGTRNKMEMGRVWLRKPVNCNNNKTGVMIFILLTHLIENCIQNVRVQNKPEWYKNFLSGTYFGITPVVNCV